MRISRWVPKATNTHSEYVTRIVFTTATMVTRTRLEVTLHALCLTDSIVECSGRNTILYITLQQAENCVVRHIKHSLKKAELDRNIQELFL